MRIQIQKFDVASMKPHRIALMVGKRGTCKSTLIEDVMFHMRDKVHIGLAMTPTEESAQMFRRHMPPSWIYNSYSPSTMEQIIVLQRDLCRKGKQRNLFLALDDCMYDKKILKSTNVRDVFMNGRHLKLSVLLACQYIMDMGPDLRSQVDYVFALRENIISNKTKLFKYFFGMFEKFEDFSRVMDACTENYSCLVLDNTSKSNRIEDCLFWYRADIDLPSYSVGDPKFLQLARVYGRGDDDPEEYPAPEEAKDKAERRITRVDRCDENGKLLE